MKSLHVEAITVNYDRNTILQDLSLTLDGDHILCLLGASGCGKTTLLKAVAGLIPLSAGKILMNGRDFSEIPVENRKIGMIFQDYALFPHLTVAENIAFGLNHLSKKARIATVNEMAELVQLPDLLQRYPHELSGGQQQRVAIARSLACQPELLLLDEPFSNIDSQVRFQLIDEIKAILKSQQVSAIFVTHSKEEAFIFADKLALMDQGKIVQYGSPIELYQHPHNRFVADFLGVSNYIPCCMQQEGILSSPLGQHCHCSELRLANGQRLPKNKPLYCLMRPQDLNLSDEGQLNGIILNRHFLGHTFNYTVQVGDTQLSVYSSKDLPLQSAVNVTAKCYAMKLYE